MDTTERFPSHILEHIITGTLCIQINRRTFGTEKKKTGNKNLAKLVWVMVYLYVGVGSNPTSDTISRRQDGGQQMYFIHKSRDMVARFMRNGYIMKHSIMGTLCTCHVLPCWQYRHEMNGVVYLAGEDVNKPPPFKHDEYYTSLGFIHASNYTIQTYHIDHDCVPMCSRSLSLHHCCLLHLHFVPYYTCTSK